MGFFDDSESDSDRLAQQQIRQNQMEITQKRDALYKERLGIIKSQGAESWQPQPFKSISTPKSNKLGDIIGGM